MIIGVINTTISWSMGSKSWVDKRRCISNWLEFIIWSSTLRAPYLHVTKAVDSGVAIVFVYFYIICCTSIEIKMQARVRENK